MSIWGLGALFWGPGLSPSKPRGDGTAPISVGVNLYSATFLTGNKNSC